MRAFLFACLLLSTSLAGCLGEGREGVTSVGGVAGDVALVGGDGVRVETNGTGLRVGLDATARTGVFQACREACHNVSVEAGTLVAERNVSLNAGGPEGDAAVNFYDAGRPDGRFLRWSEGVGKFQMNADLQAVGNLSATGHVGTITPLRLQGGAIVTVSTAALQGTEVSVFARGVGRMSNGVATIMLPGAFAAIADPESLVSVQVTLTTPGPALYVAEKSTESFTVRAADGNATAAAGFDWLVVAGRKGGEDFQV